MRSYKATIVFRLELSYPHFTPSHWPIALSEKHLALRQHPDIPSIRYEILQNYRCPSITKLFCIRTILAST